MLIRQKDRVGLCKTHLLSVPNELAAAPDQLLWQGAAAQAECCGRPQQG